MTSQAPDGYVRAAGGRLVDGSGRPLLMRGVGLGNWLLPEGYMWGFTPPGPQSGRQIEALVDDLVGPERAAAFWEEFRSRFITEADIAEIAAEGLDHVRLPLNSRFLIDQDGHQLAAGFVHVDNLIDWCRRHGLWVILDLHGAPGGQTGTNIDDSPRGLPELFVDRRHQELTVELWRGLAARYADETTVAGYDLLNEPLPNEFQHRYASSLVSLYRELTEAIRAVDDRHLIIYEGTHWATNWTIFDEVWDPNSMLQFHKYWSPPDRPSIARFLETRERLGLPIYMGEGGENNPEWLQVAFELYETFDISWNLWPWKKLDTRTSPRSVRPPAGWAAITGFAAGAADKPSPDAAGETLWQVLDALAVDQCERRPEVLDACLRRAPLTFGAAGFGFRGPGRSYGTSTAAAPLVGFRNDDDVTLRHGAGEPETLNFSHTTGDARTPDEEFVLVLAPGDWVVYEFSSHAGPHELEVSSDHATRAEIQLDQTTIEPRTGHDHVFDVALDQGPHRLRVRAVRDTVRVSAIAVRPAYRP